MTGGADKLDAYALQDRGLVSYDANLALGHQADERDYTSAAQMLHALGADHIVLLSNNPDKGAQLARLSITIASQVPTALHLTGANAAHLATEARRGGHDLLSRNWAALRFSLVMTWRVLAWSRVLGVGPGPAALRHADVLGASRNPAAPGCVASRHRVPRQPDTQMEARCM